MHDPGCLTLTLSANIPDGSIPFPLTAKRGKSAAKQAARTKILVVDDQKLVADTVGEVLESSGFHSCVTYDARSALDLAPEFRPDFLLADVMMPGMDGVQLAITFRERYPEVTILLFSGQAGLSELLEEAARQGHHFEVIAKPIHPARLIERLRER